MNSLINGVPEPMRGRIWCCLCGINSLRDHYDSGLYHKLLEQMTPYEDYVIQKDIDRTLSNLEIFKNNEKGIKDKLFNVLKAYSVYDNLVGYIQGINYIVGLLVMKIQDEEAAFWCLVSIMNKKNWRMIYDCKLNLIILIFCILSLICLS